MKIHIALAFVLALTACSATPSVVGTWHREADPSKYNNGSNWTDIRFTQNKMTVTHSVSFRRTNTTPKPPTSKHASWPYDDLGNGVICTDNNGSPQDYRLEVKGDQLFVTPISNADARQIGPTDIYDRVK